MERPCSPSVTMPSVPSAPMNILVRSNPADDLRALRRVLMTLPFGSTTVYTIGQKMSSRMFRDEGRIGHTTFRNHSLFAVP